MDKYTKSVGRNTNMLLGIVVDNRGLVPEADVKRLKEFGVEVEKSFSKPFAKTSGKGNLFELKFKSTKQVSFIVIQEDISKGEQVREYELSGKFSGKWKTISKGSCIGHKRIEKVNGYFDAIKLKVTKNKEVVTIKSFACFGGK